MRYASIASVVLAVLLLAAGSMAAAAEPAHCQVKLSVQLTPDVPNARSPGFLSSLADDPMFRLIWAGSTPTRVILQLVGPGPQYRCENEMRRIERDGRVLKLDTIS
jgi:hypothetical protein